MNFLNKEVIIVGIDPAPGKNSTVCSLNDNNEIFIRNLSHNNLRTFVDELASFNKKVLIAWDAPLTGIDNPLKSEYNLQGDFTQRKLEKFFASQDNGYKPPKGISILGYGGCPHWTITQHILGYPILSRFHTANNLLPFQLIHNNEALESSSKLLVEVHPALALWMLKKGRMLDFAYKKKSKEDLQVFVKLIFQSEIFKDFKNQEMQLTIEDDDQLDALIAFLLAYTLKHNPNDVMFLGNEHTGSFLLPKNVKMQRAFTEFAKP